MVQLVTAVIKPFKLDEVKEAVRMLGLRGMTVTEVQGFGRQSGKSETFRGTEYDVELLPKVKVEVLTERDQVDSVIRAITSAARTGKIGDGKIWVTEVGQVVRVRTSEVGADAL